MTHTNNQPDLFSALQETYPETLTPEERARSTALLREYIAKNPPITEMQFGGGSFFGKLREGFSSAFTFASERHFAMPAFATLAVLFTFSGFAFAAEGAAPGDMLYPFKRHVNENVLGVLAWSQRGKAEYDIALAKRRLKETAALAIQDKLDPDSHARLTNEFILHVHSAMTRIADLEERDPETAPYVVADLHNIVATHNTVLQESSASVSRVPASLSKKDAPVAAQAALTAEVENIKKPSAEAAAISAEQIAAAEDELHLSGDELPESVRRHAETLIGAAKEKQAAGDADIQTGERRRAYENFADSLSDTLAARALISTATSSGTILEEASPSAEEPTEDSPLDLLQ